MLSEKLFEVTVDVRNPIDHCADKRRHLMAALQDTYVGRCYMGVFIARVKEIRRTSPCCLVTTNASGEGRVDVEFLADVAVFSRWDILVGVEIAIAQPVLAGQHTAAARPSAPEPGELYPGAPPKAVVSFLPSKAVETLAVGQRVAARVVAAQHPPLQPQAAVIGALLVCDGAAPVYRLRAGGLDAAARAELEPLLERAEAELAARAALVEARPGDVWFFELLLYAYRHSPGAESQFVEAWAGGPVWAGPPAVPPRGGGEPPESVSVLELARRAIRGEVVALAGLWSRPLALYRSSPLACRVPPGVQPPADWGAPLEATPRAVFAEYLKNILDFLVAVREMAAVYSTREEVDRHRNLWAVMRAAQQTA